MSAVDVPASAAPVGKVDAAAAAAKLEADITAARELAKTVRRLMSGEEEKKREEFDAMADAVDQSFDQSKKKSFFFLSLSLSFSISKSPLFRSILNTVMGAG